MLVDDDATRFSGFDSRTLRFRSRAGDLPSLCRGVRPRRSPRADRVASSRPPPAPGSRPPRSREHNPDAELAISDLNDAMLEFARAKVPPGTRRRGRGCAAPPVRRRELRRGRVPVRHHVRSRPGGGFPRGPSGARSHRRLLTSRSGTAMPRTGSLPSPMACWRRPFPDDPPPFYRVPFGMSDVNRLRDLAQSTGFGRVRMDVVPHDAPVASWADFADGLIVGNPVADQLRRRSADLDVLVSETAHRLSDRVRGSADDDPGADAVLPRLRALTHPEAAIAHYRLDNITLVRIL